MKRLIPLTAMVENVSKRNGPQAAETANGPRHKCIRRKDMHHAL